jgi:4-hydroxy-2-oxoheptanedioate aldolase
MNKRINKIIDLVAQGQPAYYVSTEDFTYENGLKLSKTWADFIRLDASTAPFDTLGIRRFMQGLLDGGPTASGHRMVPVIAELPTDGSDEQVMRANAWMCRHLLNCGVHGLILCHAETPGAVKAFVESCRYSFQTIGLGYGIGRGRRGNAGQEFPAKMWGVSAEEYVHLADPWPLNPQGQLILGIKMENKRALENSQVTVRVPGVCFGEWGLADMSMDHGYPVKPNPASLPEHLQKIKERVWGYCRKAGMNFLCIVTDQDVETHIDKGLKFCRAYEEKVAEKGRKYSQRPKPW